MTKPKLGPRHSQQESISNLQSYTNLSKENSHVSFKLPYVYSTLFLFLKSEIAKVSTSSLN